MDKLKKFFSNKHAMAVAVFLMWLMVWGIIFFVGNYLENILLFILFYNMIYPIATVALCYICAKKNGVVYYLPVSMGVVAGVLYFATELVKYALPNALVLTLVCVIFSSGIGNIMHHD